MALAEAFQVAMKQLHSLTDINHLKEVCYAIKLSADATKTIVELERDREDKNGLGEAEETDFVSAEDIAIIEHYHQRIAEQNRCNELRERGEWPPANAALETKNNN